MISNLCILLDENSRKSINQSINYFIVHLNVEQLANLVCRTNL